MANLSLYELKKNKSSFKKEKITGSETAANYIRNFYSDDIGIYESFFILLLNNNSQTIGYAKISQGGIVGTIVDVKIIAKYVVDSLATGIILAHNHPSGTLLPSQADKDITKKVTEVLKYFDCKVLDHIIMTEDSYFSFADSGIL